MRAEGAVSYGRVVEAMDHARGAGAERIGILGRSDSRYRWTLGRASRQARFMSPCFITWSS